MDLNPQRLSRYLPLGLPVATLVVGWILLVQPRLIDNARVAKEIDNLQQRLAGVRVAVAQPLPAGPERQRLARFEAQVSGLDPISALLEELARLAAAARVSNLLVETGDRMAVDAGSAGGPQATSGPAADPRFTLFTVPLAYSPVTMSFDAQYDRTGDLLWTLRDLATTVEIRDFEARPVVEGPATGDAAPRSVHVSLTLFAYAGHAPAPSGGSPGVLR